MAPSPAFAQLYNAESLARAGGIALGAEAADGNPIASIGLPVSTVAYGIYKVYDFVFAPADVGSGGNDGHTVRFQAQGDGLEASVTINSNQSITVKDGHLGLTQLARDIGRNAAELRGPGFAAASRYVSTCGASCGCPQLNNRSFPGYGNSRVDVNIIRGQNFIAGGRSGSVIWETVFGAAR